MADANDPWRDPEFELAVRETAYFLWEQDGKPMGREQEYWFRALERTLRERNSDRELRSNGHASAPRAEQAGASNGDGRARPQLPDNDHDQSPGAADEETLSSAEHGVLASAIEHERDA